MEGRCADAPLRLVLPLCHCPRSDAVYFSLMYAAIIVTYISGAAAARLPWRRRRGADGRAARSPMKGRQSRSARATDRFVVVCEHASNRLPRALGTLGLWPADLERHIAWDPGAADVAAGSPRGSAAISSCSAIRALPSTATARRNSPDAIADALRGHARSPAIRAVGRGARPRASRRLGAVPRRARDAARPARRGAAADGAGHRPHLHAGLSRRRAAVACRHHLDRRTRPCRAMLAALRRDAAWWSATTSPTRRRTMSTTRSAGTASTAACRM